MKAENADGEGDFGRIIIGGGTSGVPVAVDLRLATRARVPLPKIINALYDQLLLYTRGVILTAFGNRRLNLKERVDSGQVFSSPCVLFLSFLQNTRPNLFFQFKRPFPNSFRII